MMPFYFTALLIDLEWLHWRKTKDIRQVETLVLGTGKSSIKSFCLQQAIGVSQLCKCFVLHTWQLDLLIPVSNTGLGPAELGNACVFGTLQAWCKWANSEPCDRCWEFWEFRHPSFTRSIEKVTPKG
mmetsp:Transcript_13/g.109  ORF Transcript_13/g.109 Transcript_13/m.109 type:complete len:127 (+) Transcript_13:6787-7167(+)|eukprot:CAMPEP_0113927768 /NCGR_PEP_ID=MMETSP1159-20121227/4472_1 /TAXON_ID=88271 /ORGANISM="Picocystis salinarum" /LENGTH=126 /DNA_ID=CAMNT_0000928265 /DNA_START=3202 /DNA_END=3582 /DNA_ORIENTATION=+ /assembly_acc=CAM_ASM_000767